MKVANLILTVSILINFTIIDLSGQEVTFNLKKEVTGEEVKLLQQLFENISESDQKYRRYISSETLDDKLIEEMDAVYDSLGIEAFFKYRSSLNLKLDQVTKDSLWGLQHEIDLANHLALRGVFATYGYLPETLLKEKEYVQLLLLMHPPKDWNIQKFHADYSELLMGEVEAGRMPAKTYATFYDNIKAKILREPQLYGTNEQFDPKTNKVLAPVIENLAQTNEARTAIGLPTLKEGEYRLSERR